MFDPNKSGTFEAYSPQESRLANVLLAILLMLALIGMLVYATK